MPSLGADMSEGKLLGWRVKEGDWVEKGQILAEIETQKAAVEMESFKSGQILCLRAKPQDVLPVGALIAEMELDEASCSSTASSSSSISSSPSKSRALEPEPEPEPEIPQRQTPVTPPEAKAPRPVRASPAAKRLAQEKKLDLSQIQGTGKDGVIELSDVERFTPTVTAPLTALRRKAIAQAMSRSKREIPHYYLRTDVRMDSVLKQLDQWNENRPVAQRILLSALWVKAVSDTLIAFPELNGFYENDQFVAQAPIHIGIVTALKEGGVMVPALLDTHEKSLVQLGAEFNDLIDRTRRQKLRTHELTEGTFTITNLGDLGVEEVIGVIFPPQVAILGIGRLHKAPFVTGDELSVGYRCRLTLSGDHRVTDGILGSRFLRRLTQNIERIQIND